MITRRTMLKSAGAAAIAAPMVGLRSAYAAWPDRPVKLLVPFGPGGPADVIARLIGAALSERFGQSFFIENRPGATGNIGTLAVVNAKPDGCTLLINAAVIATFPASFSRLPYDPLKVLVPVGGIGVTPTLLVAAKSVPADDLKGLVQLSKERPDGLSFSTAGYGLLQHLAVEEMAQRTGGKFVHVVYKGGAQAATDLIAARVDFGSFAAGSVIQFVKGGELKPLAVVQPTRSDLMPEVATIAEQGLPGLDAGVHFMLYAPAATPADVISLLNGELNKIVGDPALKARFANLGYDPTALTPDAAAAIMRTTGEAWAPLIKRLNIKLD